MSRASTVSESEEIERLRELGGAELAEQFSAARDQLRRLVALRLTPQLAARIDPSDVLQDAFVEANRRLPEFLADTKVSPLTWLRQITRQTLSVLYRSHTGTAQRDVNREACQLFNSPDAQSMVIEIEESVTSPHSAAVREEARDVLREILAEMDDIDREILALKVLERKTYPEVAEELGLPVKTTRKRFNDAIVRIGKLAAHLKEVS